MKDGAIMATAETRIYKPLGLSAFRGISVRKLFIIAVAFIYAIVLANLPLLNFRDRTNYLEYAAASSLIWQRYAERGTFVLLANEPVWLLINILLRLWLEPENVLRVLIGGSAFLAAWSLMRSQRIDMIWFALVLLYPGFIKNFIIHLRQGCAIAVFLLGVWGTRHRWLRRVLIGLAPFIHSAFFPVIAMLLTAHLSRRLKIANDLSVALFFVVTLILILTLPVIATEIGARQAFEYKLLSAPEVSGLNFAFWLVMLFLMLSASREFLREHRFQIGLIILYLGTYFTFYPGARIFENGLPLVLQSGLNLKGWQRRIFRWAVFAQGIAIWALGFPLTLVP